LEIILGKDSACAIVHTEHSNKGGEYPMSLTLVQKDEIIEILEGADEGLTRASEALQECETLVRQKYPSLAKQFERLESECQRLIESIDDITNSSLSHIS
jgi:hypothetical protein